MAKKVNFVPLTPTSNMGIYINKGNEGFRFSLNGEYVDKTLLIAEINKTLCTESRYSCVTRCRRFGKSMAAKMLCAYYDHSCHSRELFQGLKIATDSSFETHLNKYPVIYVDMTTFTTRFMNDSCVVLRMQQELKADVLEAYPKVKIDEVDDLMNTLLKIATQTGERFIMIIDEWDAILREFDRNSSVTEEYVNLLRRLFKGLDSELTFAGVYLTGILPIKKYNTQSALNNFNEYSMVQPRRLAGYFGFTREEVVRLCEKYAMDFKDVAEWYDGYQIGEEPSVFNPNSVMMAMRDGMCDSYWASTGAYDSIVRYIKMNYDGVKDGIIKMLAGGRCKVNTTKFQNDMSIINSRDDVFTVLIHLGYLAYDKAKTECYIPNKEVCMEMTNAVEATDWKNLISSLEASENLLKATLEGDEEAVARGIDLAHDENTSILSYNDENSLACVLSIAYYYAKNDYIIHRELATGKGFADLVLIPRRKIDSPALVLELKYNRDADSAIAQIRRKQYPAKVAEYTGNLLLVGINYDKQTKTHTCRIERV